MGSYISLGVFALLCLVAASSGAAFSPGEWYKSLRRPSWTPPDWAFPVVWSVLYVMIAIAGWLVWQAEGFGLALALWWTGLVVNAAWSWIMFGRKDIAGALVDVALLWLLTAGFILAAWDVSRTASLLFLPYLAWVTTAAALNYEVWRLNRESIAQ
jgi:tryptophan-rich sensory protein